MIKLFNYSKLLQNSISIYIHPMIKMAWSSHRCDLVERVPSKGQLGTLIFVSRLGYDEFV